MGILCALAALVYVGLGGSVCLAVLFFNIIQRLLLGLIGYADRIGTYVGNKSCGAFALYLHTLIQLLGYHHGELCGKAQLSGCFLLHAAGGERSWSMTGLFAHLYIRHGKLFAGAGDYIVGAIFVLNVSLFALKAIEAGLHRLACALYLQLCGDCPELFGDKVHYLLLAIAYYAGGNRLHTACGKAPAHLCPEYGADLIAHKPIQHTPCLLCIHKIHVNGTGSLYGLLYSVGSYLVEYYSAGRICVQL